jgi:hypothetical protein
MGMLVRSGLSIAAQSAKAAPLWSTCAVQSPDQASTFGGACLPVATAAVRRVADCATKRLISLNTEFQSPA